VARFDPVGADVAKRFGVEPCRSALLDKPRWIAFAMALAASNLAETSVGQSDAPLKDLFISLANDELPPRYATGKHTCSNTESVPAPSMRSQSVCGLFSGTAGSTWHHNSCPLHRIGQ
jgi:hypothetical protein